MSMDEQSALYEIGKFCLFKKVDIENSYGNYNIPSIEKGIQCKNT
jgi:hypothetical protein